MGLMSLIETKQAIAHHGETQGRLCRRRLRKAAARRQRGTRIVPKSRRRKADFFMGRPSVATHTMPKACRAF